MVSLTRPFLLALLVAAVPARAADVAVRVARDGDALQVEASAVLDATIPHAWRVITDYGHFAEFLPDLAVSRVVARDGNRVEVEQKGALRFLFLRLPVEVRFAVTEHPRERIVSRAVAGSFREMQAAFSLEADGQRVLLRYSARLVPDFFVPPLIGPMVLRRSMEASFRALAEEIERRPGEPRKP